VGPFLDSRKRSRRRIRVGRPPTSPCPARRRRGRRSFREKRARPTTPTCGLTSECVKRTFVESRSAFGTNDERRVRPGRVVSATLPGSSPAVGLSIPNGRPALFDSSVRCGRSRSSRPGVWRDRRCSGGTAAWPRRPRPPPRSEASTHPRSGDRGKAIRASFARAFDAGVRDADPDRHELAVPRDRRLPTLGLPGTDTERPDVADKPHRHIVRQALEVGS
jgi:hypothetical protein